MEKIRDIESVLEQSFYFNAFGQNLQYQLFKYQEPLCFADDQHISQDITGTVIYTDKGTEASEHLVIKTINEKCSYPFKHLALLGEMSIRRRIIPYLEKYSPGICSHFAKFYFGSVSSTTENDDAIIILEELPYTPSPLLWDHRHLFVVMKFLAKFHAASYNAKNKDSNVFLPMLRRLHEIDFSQHENAHNSKLAELVPASNSPKEYFKSILSNKIEPLSVVCVGTMAAPQTLFQYDTEGNPVDVKFHEFFGSRYASPAFDLMNVLYLCTNQETRIKYWNEALKLYYDNLVKAVNDDKAPTFQRIQEDFHAYSLLAFSIAPAALAPYFDSNFLNVILNDVENFILNKNAEE